MAEFRLVDSARHRVASDDAGAVHNRGPADSEELVRIKPLFKRGHAFSEKMSHGSAVQHGEVIRPHRATCILTGGRRFPKLGIARSALASYA
jgi:hypothetical protein